MNVLCRGVRWAPGLAALAGAALVLARPQAAVLGVSEGLARCYSAIIPALFPFFVLSQLFLESPVARLAGIPLRPVARSLGLERQSAGLLLAGWVGGFAVAAKGVGLQLRAGQLNRRQGQIALLACAAAGPSFAISAVGYLLLGSSRLGVCLYLAQLPACWLAALAARMLAKEQPREAPPSTSAPGGGFAAAVSQGVNSTLTVCGYVIFFQLLYRLLAPADSWPLATLLEMTLGCSQAALLPTGQLTAAAVSISLLGLCAFAQIRALAGISVLPLLVSRLVHLPLMLAFTRLFVRLWPGETAAWAGSEPAAILPFRMPKEAALVFFALAFAFTVSGRPALQSRQGKL